MNKKQYLFLVTLGQVEDPRVPLMDLYIYADNKDQVRLKIKNILNPKIFGILKIIGGENDELPNSIPSVIETPCAGTEDFESLKDALKKFTHISSGWDPDRFKPIL